MKDREGWVANRAGYASNCVENMGCNELSYCDAAAVGLGAGGVADRDRAALLRWARVVASTILGPGRTGSVKETIYESGVAPIGDTRRRFNARFYIVAMIFVVFDVEIVFFYPWATIFPLNPTGLLLGEMLVFVLILLVAYLYAWGKGVFRWD